MRRSHRNVYGARFHYPATDVTDKKAKTTNYQAVQRTAMKFKQEMGSYICADLLKIKRQPEDATPSGGMLVIMLYDHVVVVLLWLPKL